MPLHKAQMPLPVHIPMQAPFPCAHLPAAATPSPNLFLPLHTLQDWDVAAVTQWLSDLHLGKYSESFVANNVNGATLHAVRVPLP